jgi:hypothetical protein
MSRIARASFAALLLSFFLLSAVPIHASAIRRDDGGIGERFTRIVKVVLRHLGVVPLDDQIAVPKP